MSLHFAFQLESKKQDDQDQHGGYGDQDDDGYFVFGDDFISVDASVLSFAADFGAFFQFPECFHIEPLSGDQRGVAVAHRLEVGQQFLHGFVAVFFPFGHHDFDDFGDTG